MARTLAKDRGQKQASILKAAAHTFAQEGIVRASMGQVAVACGISKANIYHYYNSKNDLLFDILDSYLRTLRDHVCGLDGTDMMPAQRLHHLVEETLLFYEGMDDEHKIQTEGLKLLTQAQQEVLRAYQRELVATFSSALRALAPQVFDDHPKKLRAATLSLFGMLNWFYMWNRNASPARRKTYAEMVSRLAVGGVQNLGGLDYEHL